MEQISFSLNDFDLSFLSGETFFGLASRFHFLTCNSSSWKTSMQLFGGRRCGYQHDFPSGIDEFISRTHGRLGNIQDIFLNHTILPFFLPFLCDGADEAVRLCFSTGDVRSLKYRLGLLTSLFGARHPLKVCPVCMRNDRHSFGVASWRVEQQLPGLWWCREHQCMLMECREKSLGSGRFNWYLPDERNLSFRKELDLQALNAKERIAISDFSKMAAELGMKGKSLQLERFRLASAYRYALVAKNLTSSKGRFRMNRIGAAYLNFTQPFTKLPELTDLVASERSAAYQISRLTYPPRVVTHPIRHLMAIIWLFSSWDEFIDVYNNHQVEDAQSENLSSGDEIVDDQFRESQLARLQHSVLIEGMSVSGAAHLCGIDVATAMAWLARLGIPTPSRPKTLKGRMREEIEGMLSDGEDKDLVASKFEISISTVTRFLRTTVGLQLKWHNARRLKCQNRNRAEWRLASEKYPTFGVKRLREIAPAQYAWLYRNDRSWLCEQISKVPAVKRTNNSQVDWDARDRQLAIKVQAVAQEIKNGRPPHKVTLNLLSRSIPELKAKLSALKKGCVRIFV